MASTVPILEVRMAVVAKFKLNERIERAGTAFDEEHFGVNASCRVPGGSGYDSTKCTHRHPGSETDVRFLAVTEGQENADWAAATSWGELRMSIANPAALRQLEVGAIYTVTLQKARG